MLEALQPFRSRPTRPPVGYTGSVKPPRLFGAGQAYAGQPSTTGAQSSVAISRGLWEAGPDGTATAEVGLFRLIVHRKVPGGHARFLVLRHPEDARTCRPTLLASGHGEDAEAAMLAAARTVARLAGDAAPWPHAPRAG
jgi:hypothetical protein